MGVLQQKWDFFGISKKKSGGISIISIISIISNIYGISHRYQDTQVAEHVWLLGTKCHGDAGIHRSTDLESFRRFGFTAATLLCECGEDSQVHGEWGSQCICPFQKMAILMYVNGDDEALLEAYPGFFHKLMKHSALTSCLKHVETTN